MTEETSDIDDDGAAADGNRFNRESDFFSSLREREYDRVALLASEYARVPLRSSVIRVQKIANQCSI